jgi:hypothetical protein
VGPTFSRIIADQFQRLRDGDRFWYQNVFQGEDLKKLENTTLSDLIKRNTGLTNLQKNVFFFQTAITGKVFADVNQNGLLNPGERGLAGRVVQLLDGDGNVLATTRTASDGTYRFSGLELGTYQVREVLPPGATSTTPTLQPITITKGMIVTNINLGEAVHRPKPPNRPDPIRPGQNSPAQESLTFSPDSDLPSPLKPPRRR